MWYGLVVSLLGLSIPCVNAASAVILEQLNGVPQGWSFHHSADASDKITLFVALKETGIDEIKATLDQRHSPGSLSSDRHLSRDEVHRYRQPTRVTANAVTSWLRSQGIRNVHNQGSLISFEVSVEIAKSLFQADLAYYAYDGSDTDPVLRALSYKIPAWLRGHIDFVHPITNFMPPRPYRGHRHRPQKPWQKPWPKPWPKPHPKPTKVPSATATVPTETPIGTPTPPPESDYPPFMPCMAATVPECIKELYNINYTATTPSPVRFGVAGFLEQWILYSDVDQFLDIFAPEMADMSPPYNFSVELINGGTNPQDSPRNAGIEASLDVQYAVALGYPTNITYYITGGRGVKLEAMTGQPLPVEYSDNEPFLEFLTALLEKPDDEIPHVLSISYADDEVSVPRPYAMRVCDMFAALAARGVSVLVASGDGGAAGTGQTSCTRKVDDGGSYPYHPGNLTTGSPLREAFVATFPGSCPYVTSVGATDSIGPPTTAAAYSAGGFSDFFPRPAWQDAAVGPYVERVVREKDRATFVAMFNRTGRAQPDISAIGSGFQIVMGGEPAQVLGTSASAPVVAAMVALANDARMRAGEPSLGWLNPRLYGARVRAGLRDVVHGASRGCRFEDGFESEGWPAVEGYDCVTGLGVVRDFGEFMAALMD
ncbi:hypothetical protein VTK26DRAFT_9001 [Humicola hyalothermophila]